MADGKLVVTIPDALAGARLDQALATLLPQYSRSLIQRWIRDGDATVDGDVRRPRDRVIGGERVALVARLEPDARWGPEPMSLVIVHEDEHVLVVDKPAGLVVHPGAGHPSGTLVNALLAHDPRLASVPRAGIVHRLDKDTSGLLVVARDVTAHKYIVEALARRDVKREYAALVWGSVASSGSVDAPIGRHPTRRTRMAVVAGGRPARTHYRVAETLPAHTLLDVALDTGRTHQIRVHLAHLGYPLVGDPVYGGGRTRSAGLTALAAALGGLGRQALHARRLGFQHPLSGAPLSFESALPADLTTLLAALRDAGGAPRR